MAWVIRRSQLLAARTVSHCVAQGDKSSGSGVAAGKSGRSRGLCCLRNWPAELSSEPPLPKTSLAHPQTTHPWKTPFRLFSHAFCSSKRQTPHLDCFRRPPAGLSIARNGHSPFTGRLRSPSPNTALLEDRHQRIHLRLSAPSTATRSSCAPRRTSPTVTTVGALE